MVGIVRDLEDRTMHRWILSRDIFPRLSKSDRPFVHIADVSIGRAWKQQYDFARPLPHRIADNPRRFAAGVHAAITDVAQSLRILEFRTDSNQLRPARHFSDQF